MKDIRIKTKREAYTYYEKEIEAQAERKRAHTKRKREWGKRLDWNLLSELLALDMI